MREQGKNKREIDNNEQHGDRLYYQYVCIEISTGSSLEGKAYKTHLTLLGAKGGKGMMLFAACTCRSICVGSKFRIKFQYPYVHVISEIQP